MRKIQCYHFCETNWKLSQYFIRDKAVLGLFLFIYLHPSPSPPILLHEENNCIETCTGRIREKGGEGSFTVLHLELDRRGKLRHRSCPPTPGFFRFLPQQESDSRWRLWGHVQVSGALLGPLQQQTNRQAGPESADFI